MQDIQSYQEQVRGMTAEKETQILVEVLEAEVARADEELLQAIGIDNEEVLKRLQEVWEEEDKMMAEAMKAIEAEKLIEQNNI